MDFSSVPRILRWNRLVGTGKMVSYKNYSVFSLKHSKLSLYNSALGKKYYSCDEIKLLSLSCIIDTCTNFLCSGGFLLQIG